MSGINADAVLAALSARQGREMGITVKELAARLRAGALFVRKNDDRTVRAAVEELRRKGVHICGTPSDGYYIARTEEELLATCRFLYDRAMTSLTQVAAMRKAALPDLRQPLRLV